MTTAQLSLSWRERAPSKCQALRELLSDGRWHNHSEMMAAGGARFGGRLHEIRRGVDGGPQLNVEKKAVGGDVLWLYRCVGEVRP